MTHHVFALEDGATATAQVPSLDGSIETSVNVTRMGARIEISFSETGKPFTLLLRGIPEVASVADGTAQPDALGTRIVPKKGVKTIIVHLEETV